MIIINVKKEKNKTYFHSNQNNIFTIQRQTNKIKTLVIIFFFTNVWDSH